MNKTITDNIEWFVQHLAWVFYWMIGITYEHARELIPLVIGSIGGVVLIYMNYQKALKYLAERRKLEEKKDGGKD